MLTVDPFEMLHQYDVCIRQIARKLPLDEVPSTWLGIELKCLSEACLVPLSWVREIIVPSHITRVPGSHPWLCGLINHRGTLIPVTDVTYWLTNKPSTAKNTRILVVEHEHALYGLRFESVLGLQRLTGSTSHALQTPSPLSPFVTEVQQSANQEWMVLDLNRLLSQNSFLQTALISPSLH